mmetsp:Transcript_103906/g.320492  ORF Transcript_103906/g.320492 Transcript_103906/m.320492 type:complete len:263 (+) Transcript_103906:236-1024(+)
MRTWSMRAWWRPTAPSFRSCRTSSRRLPRSATSWRRAWPRSTGGSLQPESCAVRWSAGAERRRRPSQQRWRQRLGRHHRRWNPQLQVRHCRAHGRPWRGSPAAQSFRRRAKLMPPGPLVPAGAAAPAAAAAAAWDLPPHGPHQRQLPAPRWPCAPHRQERPAQRRPPGTSPRTPTPAPRRAAGGAAPRRARTRRPSRTGRTHRRPRGRHRRSLGPARRRRCATPGLPRESPRRPGHAGVPPAPDASLAWRPLAPSARAHRAR